MNQQGESEFAKTGPGTLAGRYLRLFWQPVFRAQDLAPGQAVPLTIMGERFTLYRGESGAPHVLAFRCAHRGTQLSTGWVEGDCLRCLYHGWRYDDSGRCVEQPGEDEAFAAKIRIKSYPAHEYLGLIFAYLGDGEPPPMPSYPEFEQPGVLDVYPPEYWPCNYFNRIDNAPDAAHLAFAHRESRSAINSLRALPEISTEETPYGVMTRMKSPGRPVHSVHFHMPNINMFLIPPAEGRLRDAAGAVTNGCVGRLLFRVPVDDDSCVSFPIDHVPLPGSAGDEYLASRRAVEAAQQAPGKDPVDFAEAVLTSRLSLTDVKRADPGNLKTLTSVEDYVVQVGQGSPDEREEHMGRMDAGVLLIRKVWQRELRALAAGKPLTSWRHTPIEP